MKSAIAIAAMLGLAWAGPCAPAAEPFEIPLWPSDALSPPASATPEKIVERGKTKPDRSISNVTRPTLTMYLPPADRAAGAAVVICPGGGYGGLAIDKEGHDVARWLNSVGVAGVVLKYRMPHPELMTDRAPLPLQDAQRALRLVRSRARDWKLDPHCIGIMGFSAGGHLASTAGTHFDGGQAGAADPVSRISSRPDFMILVYPVISMKDPVAHQGSRRNLLGETPDEKLIACYSNELQVTARTPPAFLVHARDDGVKVANSIQFCEALRRAQVPCELQLYDQGGHGYGLGVRGGEVAGWPARCQAWMKTRKLLPGG